MATAQERGRRHPAPAPDTSLQPCGIFPATAEWMGGAPGAQDPAKDSVPTLHRPLHWAGARVPRPRGLAGGAPSGHLGGRLPLGSPAPVPSTCCRRRPEAVYGRPGAHWARAPPHSAWPAARPHTSPFNWAFSLTQCHAGLFCQRRHNLCSLKPGGARGRCSRNSSRPLGAAQQERGGAGPRVGAQAGPRRPPGTPLLGPRRGPGPRHLEGPQQVLHPARAPGALGQGNAHGQRRVGHRVGHQPGQPEARSPRINCHPAPPRGAAVGPTALSLLPSATTCPPPADSEPPLGLVTRAGRSPHWRTGRRVGGPEPCKCPGRFP